MVTMVTPATTMVTLAVVLDSEMFVSRARVPEGIILGAQGTAVPVTAHLPHDIKGIRGSAALGRDSVASTLDQEDHILGTLEDHGSVGAGACSGCLTDCLLLGARTCRQRERLAQTSVTGGGRGLSFEF